MQYISQLDRFTFIVIETCTSVSTCCTYIMTTQNPPRSDSVMVTIWTLIARTMQVSSFFTHCCIVSAFHADITVVTMSFPCCCTACIVSWYEHYSWGCVSGWFRLCLYAIIWHSKAVWCLVVTQPWTVFALSPALLCRYCTHSVHDCCMATV